MIQLPFAMPKLTIGRIILGALVLALIFQTGALSVARATRDKAIAQRDQVLQESNRLIEAAQGSEHTIKELRSANKALVGALAAQQRAYDQAAAQIEPLKQLAESQARALRERERIDRATPKCQLVLNTDVGGACPALADGVRQRADRRLPGQTG